MWVPGLVIAAIVIVVLLQRLLISPALVPVPAPSFSGLSCPLPSAEFSSQGAQLKTKFSDGHFFVPVCFGSKGPYSFALDTGSATTTISTSLASSLHLAVSASGRTIFGGSGHTTVHFTRLKQWDMSGIALRNQTVWVATSLPSGGAGIIGMDVLSRLVAIRLDYALSSVSVASPEKAGLAATRTAVSDVARHSTIPDAFLRAGKRQVSFSGYAPTYESPLANDVPIVAIYFNHQGPYYFEIDTGSPYTVVQPWVVKRLRLTRLGSSARIISFGGVSTAPYYSTGSWGFFTASIPSAAHVLESSISFNRHIAGLLGENVLSEFQYVLVDFKDQMLILGGAAKAL